MCRWQCHQEGLLTHRLLSPPPTWEADFSSLGCGLRICTSNAPSTCFGFRWFFFSSFLRWKVLLLIWALPYVFVTIHFPLSAAHMLVIATWMIEPSIIIKLPFGLSLSFVFQSSLCPWPSPATCAALKFSQRWELGVLSGHPWGSAQPWACTWQ